MCHHHQAPGHGLVFGGWQQVFRFFRPVLHPPPPVSFPSHSLSSIFFRIDSTSSIMLLFKAKRDLALVGVAVILFLCLSMATREATRTHKGSEEEMELYNRHDDKPGYAQYRPGERVASGVHVNWDRGLVPETEITSHVPGSSFQRLLRTESTDLLVTRFLRNSIIAGHQWYIFCCVGPSKSTSRGAVHVFGLERYQWRTPKLHYPKSGGDPRH